MIDAGSGSASLAPPPMSHVFVSYAREDQSIADRLIRRLRDAGFQPWWDKDGIRPGQNWSREIDVMLSTSAAVVVLWTEHSVASEWVINEAAAGKEDQKLVPVLLRRPDSWRIPIEFRRDHYVDLIGWSGGHHDGLDDLLASVSELVARHQRDGAQSGAVPQVTHVDLTTRRGTMPDRRLGQGGLYWGGCTYFISKVFGRLQLVPHAEGLRLVYTQIAGEGQTLDPTGNLDLLLPIDAVGGIWSTARAFLMGVDSLDENVILQGEDESPDADILIKLYRDKPQGDDGRLSGKETCWLRLVYGANENQRLRIKLGPRDLIALELACAATFTLAANEGTHRPQPLGAKVAEATGEPKDPTHLQSRSDLRNRSPIPRLCREPGSGRGESLSATRDDLRVRRSATANRCVRSRRGTTDAGRSRLPAMRPRHREDDVTT